jgi:hypothetical protein
MPTSPSISGAFLASPTFSTVVYFDVDPTPFPVFEPRKFGAIKRTVPTRNTATGGLLPGSTVAYDTGSDLSSVVLEITVPYLSAQNFVSIFDLFTTVSQVVYSPDNGQTQYLCAWIPGPLGLKKPAGWLNYSGVLRLQVLSQIVGAGGVGGPGGGG